jgi:hypothetical protein
MKQGTYHKYIIEISFFYHHFRYQNSDVFFINNFLLNLNKSDISKHIFNPILIVGLSNVSLQKKFKYSYNFTT